ncbi:MAG: YggT family protein [Candidatus Rariloculaceae bacterium]
MRDSLFFLIRVLSHLYLLLFLLRFIMHWIRADFYNPLAQFVVRATNLLVVPARRVIPATSVIDLPTLAVLIIVETIATWLLLSVASVPWTWDVFASYVLFRLVNLALSLYTWTILVYVILSWVSPGGYHPLTMMLSELNQPILGRIRRILPPISGLDLSPLLAVILIQTISVAIPLPNLMR